MNVWRPATASGECRTRRQLLERNWSIRYVEAELTSDSEGQDDRSSASQPVAKRDERLRFGERRQGPSAIPRFVKEGEPL